MDADIVKDLIWGITWSAIGGVVLILIHKDIQKLSKNANNGSDN